MTIDFSQYVPPGVYVEDDSTPIVALTGNEPTVVTLVGPSVGYRTGTQEVVISSTAQVLGGANSAYVQSGLGSDPVVRTLTGQVLLKDTDYQVIVTSAAGSTPASVAIKKTNSDTNSRNGSSVLVSYQYLPPGYSDPLVFSDYDDVVAAYGPPLSASGGSDQILSPLSLAAKQAFANGASRLITVAFDPTLTDEVDALNDALGKIEADYRIGLVVPVFAPGFPATLGDAQAVATALNTHCVAATSEGYPRMGVLGLASAFNGGDAGFITVAQGVANRRTILTYPSALGFYNGYSSTTIAVDGFYLAAAEAAVLSSRGVQTPLTKKAIAGFAGIPPSIQRTQTRASKDALAQSGVCVVEQDRFSRLIVRHGLTTDHAGDVLAREISLVRGRDALYTALQVGLDNSGLIGQAIGFETLTNVKAAVSGILENAAQREVILEYTDLKVRQQSGDPSVIEVKFAYIPEYPLNYIVVAFAVNVQSGSSTLADITSVNVTTAP